MRDIKVNGVPFAGDVINQPDSVVEIEQNDQPLLIQFPGKVAIHDNREDLRIYGTRISIEIENNSATIQCFADRCQFKIHNNAANLHVYGDHNKITVNNNLGTLNIYGDHLQMTVLDNKGKLHFLGVGNQAEIQKGEATTYGYYMKTVIHPEATAKVEGKYKEFIDLGKITSITSI
ncbi:MAG: hypothetical protein PHY82_07130 [Lentisphaeria bacterium]|nr:hypothetical protein [Lentisphaeria bacterium]